MARLISTIRLQGKAYHAQEAQRGQKDMAAQFIAAAKQSKVDVERLVRDGHIELSDAEYRELIDAQKALATGSVPAAEPDPNADEESDGEVDATDAAIVLAESVYPPIHLESITGTGAAGRITKNDVQDAIDARGDA